MEFKTCEERILWELSQAEEEVARQEEAIRYLNQRIGALSEKLEALQDLIYKNATYNHSENYYDWFSISIWDQGDSENEFGGLLELVPKLKEKISLHTSEKDV